MNIFEHITNYFYRKAEESESERAKYPHVSLKLCDLSDHPYRLSVKFDEVSSSCNRYFKTVEEAEEAAMQTLSAYKAAHLVSQRIKEAYRGA
jgi:cephalosporin-C deacetylase-like acetyl esterase